MTDLGTCTDNARMIGREITDLIARIESLPEQQACLARSEMFSAVLPAFSISGRNYFHNYRYREDAMESVLHHHRRRKAKGPHGHDVDGVRPIELKSMTLKTKTISRATAIGEIDKIHAKIQDAHLLTSDFAFGLFRENQAIPLVCFMISQKDFQAHIFPMMSDAATEYRKKTDNMRKKARDSFRISLGDIASLPSFEAFCPDKPPATRFLNESLRREMPSLATAGIFPNHRKKSA